MSFSRSLPLSSRWQINMICVADTDAMCVGFLLLLALHFALTRFVLMCFGCISISFARIATLYQSAHHQTQSIQYVYYMNWLIYWYFHQFEFAFTVEYVRIICDSHLVSHIFTDFDVEKTTVAIDRVLCWREEGIKNATRPYERDTVERIKGPFSRLLALYNSNRLSMNQKPILPMNWFRLPLFLSNKVTSLWLHHLFIFSMQFSVCPY